MIPSQATVRSILMLQHAKVLDGLQTAFLYFSVFLETMRREWFGIDRLRLDKFMMLVRKFVHAVFQSLQAQKW